MINWKPAHSGLITAISLGISFLLYYFFLVIPIPVPDFLFLVFYILPAILLTAAIDHGHANTNWQTRGQRLGLSWLANFAWLLVGLQLPALMNATTLGFGNTASDVWANVWPLLVISVIIAWLGIWLVRWIEKGNTALMVISQPKKRN
jgi:hypothetical protein